MIGNPSRSCAMANWRAFPNACAAYLFRGQLEFLCIIINGPDSRRTGFTAAGNWFARELDCSPTALARFHANLGARVRCSPTTDQRSSCIKM